MTTMKRRLEGLERRRTDPRISRVQLAEAQWFEKVAKALPETPVAAVSYIAKAMEPVDPQYTQRSLDSAGQVKAILESALLDVSFDLQGSVTNNTHIEVHSDIDLLVVTDKFVTVETLRPDRPRYRGDPVADLVELRDACEAALTSGFTSSAVDPTPAKALSVKKPHVECKVDVVPANWFDTDRYAQTRQKTYRGIQVLDSRTNERVKNLPFLHNARLENRDKESGGQLRRLIRLVKSVKADAEKTIDVSSYDIASLCYRLPLESYPSEGDHVQLVVSFIEFAKGVILDDDARSSMRVPNDERPIFGPTGPSLLALLSLLLELAELVGTARRRGLAA